MKTAVNLDFGKKQNNVYKIIERKYQNGTTKFFIQETKYLDVENNFGLTFDDVNIIDSSFNSLTEAVAQVEKYKEYDKTKTVSEEKIHDC